MTAVAALFVVGSSACSATGNDSPPSNADVSQFLASHGKAVLTHNRNVFGRGLADGPFRTSELAAFDNLAQLPIASWSYAIGSPVMSPDEQAAARNTYGASAVILRITLSYALRGVDPVPTNHDLWWTFVRRNGRVEVADDTALAKVGGVSWQGPWDFGPIDVIQGRSSLVIGHAKDNSMLGQVSAAADAAVPVVSSVWGTNWTRQVAVLVAGSADELTADLGPNAETTAPTAAQAVSDSTNNLTGQPLGQRLIVEPDTFAKLSPTGRTIVVTHEITHIASAVATTDASPRWLVEGFADYVGNLRSGQGVPVTAAELAADIRRGVVPNALPSVEAFDASSTAPQAYEQAWLACRLIAQLVGQDGLVRFYRTVGASSGDSAAAVQAALVSVVHVNLAQFVQRWRAYLIQQLR